MLQLVEVVHATTSSAHINVVSCYARLLEELHVVHLLVAHHNRRLQSEVNDREQFVGGARLEESMLDLLERNVQLETLA